MRAIFLSILILSTSVTLFSQRRIDGDGSDFRESRTVPAFNKIGLAVHAEVILVKGNSPGVRIEGEKNIVDRLITEVGDNQLKIYYPLLKDVRPTKPLRIWVTTPDIEGIWNSGSGTIHSEDVFTGETISFHLSGSGHVEIGVKANQVNVSMSGSGGVKVNGTARLLECGISGSGRLHADDLSVGERSKIHISGSGSVYFSTDGVIEGRISGSGCINYKGNPTSVDVHHSGSGRARKVA
ncbi:head GIN domain-containing protein [Puia sp.]|jgi:hypothetical protein|uniref:head GIN domain-containing protein n=1 Tax=Puia sp. TaxID=2045100 RepID=UPI002F3F28CD